MRSDFADTDSTYDWRRDGWLAACALTAILLIVSAAIPHAAGFDTFLRLFVFGMALVRGFVGFRRGGAWLPLSAAVIAILFNPARPVGMSAAGWMWCDLIAAAWFAIVGAWQLLGRWEPQRGWAVAVLSLGAVAVPAVGAMSTPNRDALNPLNVDQNLAVMNSDANAEMTAADMNASAPVAAANRAPAPESTPAVAHAAPSAPDAQATSRVKPVEQQQPAKAEVTVEPPPPSDAAPPDGEPANNESGGNQE
ncbi:MAG TPA: DUF6804 family protein [Sphingomicrobium sp.]|nr:DUF6804 family protein [Sphingomicrobium sp.]